MLIYFWVLPGRRTFWFSIAVDAALKFSIVVLAALKFSIVVRAALKFSIGVASCSKILVAVLREFVPQAANDRAAATRFWRLLQVFFSLRWVTRRHCCWCCCLYTACCCCNDC